MQTLEAFVVRPATPDDAEELLRLRLALDEESSFMLFEPGERLRSAEEQRRSVEQLLAAGSMILLAIEGSRPVGVVEVLRERFRRNRHSAELNIGVRADHAGRGIGRQLLAEAEAWCRSAGVSRLALTVMVHNGHARRLYERAGFEIEGTKRRALLVDGKWVDEILMAKLL